MPGASSEPASAAASEQERLRCLENMVYDFLPTKRAQIGSYDWLSVEIVRLYQELGRSNTADGVSLQEQIIDGLTPQSGLLGLVQHYTEKYSFEGLPGEWTQEKEGKTREQGAQEDLYRFLVNQLRGVRLGDVAEKVLACCRATLHDRGGAIKLEDVVARAGTDHCDPSRRCGGLRGAEGYLVPDAADADA
eukprot:Rhum_TRINITY_DN12832_c4_g1::Rhum_TRINITY_DN12832_c4_g1_i1::g.54942::m.54942